MNNIKIKVTYVPSIKHIEIYNDGWATELKKLIKVTEPEGDYDPYLDEDLEDGIEHA